MNHYCCSLHTRVRAKKKSTLRAAVCRYAEVYRTAPDKWEAFVDMCLNWHLRPGGRIGGYMVVPRYVHFTNEAYMRNAAGLECWKIMLRGNH